MNTNDVERLANCGILVQGKCNTDKRRELLEEAIIEIQTKDIPFESGYFGIKNYASFGDQRHDGRYDMCPKHGSIVFSIGLNYDFRVKISKNKELKVNKNNAIELLIYVLSNPEFDVYKELKNFINMKDQLEKQSEVIKMLEEDEI